MADIDWPVFAQHVAAVTGPKGPLSLRQAAEKWPETNNAMWHRAIHAQTLSAGNYLLLCRCIGLDPHDFLIARPHPGATLKSILNQTVTQLVSRETGA